MRSEAGLPTDTELTILNVLWTRGPSTVRDVYRVLNETRKTGYTTVLKLMQIMTEKGMIQPDKTVRPQVFSLTRTQKQTQGQLLRHLLDRAFSGSTGNLVLQALSTQKATPEERKRIREYLDRLEDKSS
jgi:BlaI family penicillinase repressor